MEIKREDLNPCTVQLDIVCDPDQVKQGFDKAYKEAAKQIKVPGFRPGHAPRAIIEQRVDKEAVAEIAAEIIMTDAYKKAVEEQDLKPYSTGAVTLKAIDEAEKKCELTAKVPLQPVVEIGDYSSIPVETPDIKVTDEDVDAQIEDMRQRRGTRQAVVGRGVEMGDVAVVNIKVDGEDGEGRNFMTVVGKTFPMLDEALANMQVEELKHVTLSFPDSFQEKDWAGKELSAQITLRSLSSMKLPEVEEVAESLEFGSKDELRTQVRAALEKRREEVVQDMIHEQLIETMMQRSSVCVPDTMWETVAKQNLRDLAESLSEKNMSFADYVKEKGMTEEEFLDAQSAEAKRYVMRAQLIQDLFLKENMTVSNQDLNKELDQMAQEYNMSMRELVTTLQKNKALREVHYQAIHRKVMDFLNSKADVKVAATV
jgi:trigger factor